MTYSGATKPHKNGSMPLGAMIHYIQGAQFSGCVLFLGICVVGGSLGGSSFKTCVV